MAHWNGWKWVLFILIGLVVLPACRGGEQADNGELQVGDFDYAAGNRDFQVALNGVVLQVNDVEVLAGDVDIGSGYLYVVPRINVTNNGENPVGATEFSLVDEYLNQYQSWQTSVSFAETLAGMPAVINRGEAVAGDHVFIVPAAALQANLKVRWESSDYRSRIEISLGNLAVAP